MYSGVLYMGTDGFGQVTPYRGEVRVSTCLFMSACTVVLTFDIFCTYLKMFSRRL